MKRRKTISVLACLCLIASMIPASAFAEEAPAAGNPYQPAAVSESTAPENTSCVSSVSVASETPAGEDEALSPAQETQQTQLPDADPDMNQESAPEETLQTDSAVAAEAEDQAAPAKEGASSLSEASQTEAADAEASTVPAEATATAEKTVNGIRVSGGIEGKDWIYDPEEQTLTITKDGMTVSGTATDNLIILCTMAVSAITIDNLDHGKNIVGIISGTDAMENEDTTPDMMSGKNPLPSLTVTVKGKNKLDEILGVGNVTISGTKNSSLDLSRNGWAIALFGNLKIKNANVKTQLLTAGNDLSIRDSAVKTGLLTAGRDINITGKSKVHIAPTKELKPLLASGLFPAMATAGRNINIDLAPEGIVTVKNAKVTSKDPLFPQVYPMMAMNRINITEGSKVVTPNGAHIETVDLYGQKVQVLMDGYSQTAADTSAAASAGSTSPQTGDDSMNGLLLLYGILILSGAAALISRKKGHIR